jgi:hypothetical protein
MSTKAMKLIDPATGLMECKICSARHNASLQSGYNRADGATRYFRGSWQCSNESCRSNVKIWNESKQKLVKRNPSALLAEARQADREGSGLVKAMKFGKVLAGIPANPSNAGTATSKQSSRA